MKFSIATLSLIGLWASSANAFGVVPPRHHSSLLSKKISITARPSMTAALSYGQEDDSVWEDTSNLVFESPVLKQVYPELLEYKQKYGHPNIPLGSSPGRQCQTLRRLHIQNKLSEKEVEWLNSLGFTFHSLEDVYRYADFDVLFDRLMAYEGAHPESNFQVPKKCAADPELGAWVTGIRRLGKDGVNPAHERRLEAVGFAWKSDRKCGSKFMAQYREFVQRVDVEGVEAVMAESKTVEWIQAQQEVLKRGGLSQTRVHYMGGVFGDCWTTIGKAL
jgi:hypothetical protein